MVALLLLLLLQLLLPAPVRSHLEFLCKWNVVLNNYETLSENTDKFYNQDPDSTVEYFFSKLEDSPLNNKEVYHGFPYFMKINFTCPDLRKDIKRDRLGPPKHSTPEALIRSGYLKGLIPFVLVTFQSPVNFRKWRTERLQIQMLGAPFQTLYQCHRQAYATCFLNWYTPMPMKNGSLVMEVEVSSNNQGELIKTAKFWININGFLKKEKDKLLFTLGTEVPKLIHRDFIDTPSRPLWATMDQAPVLILGGIPNNKKILLSDSGFKDFSLVEVNIDSCWLGTLQCPQKTFTASIFDTISTESTLFIRQNQLIYYFTGNYSHIRPKASQNWVRVLYNRCIKRLCPVELPGNGSEYILALAGGNEEGIFFFGTITDATVSFQQLPVSNSICEMFQVSECLLHWVIYNTEDYTFLLLLEFSYAGKKTFMLFEYIVVQGYPVDSLRLLYDIPSFIPKCEGSTFVMLLGMEKYTKQPLVPKGLFYNPFSHMLLIWGNAILQSYDKKNFIYLADFPYNISVKYVASNYKGEVVCVTENEEIWLVIEGSFKVHCLYPSLGWKIVFTLSQMQGSEMFSENETSISIFYDSMGLNQLVYLVYEDGKGRLLKRFLPVNEILVSQMITQNKPQISADMSQDYLSFIDACPFQLLQLYDLPQPQRFTRQERYYAEPPLVSSPSGFHTKVSLAIYQGLVYHLLSLHAMYNKPYADPVHDPTWRWWKDKKQHKAFYFYKASNFQSMYGLHIKMDGYEKVYNLSPEHNLPQHIFLDKGNNYSFSIYLVAQKSSMQSPYLTKRRSLRLAVVLAHPWCVSAKINEEDFINRNAILFKVVIKDKHLCFNQSISGHNLKKTSILIKVIGSAGKCFLRTRNGHVMQGNEFIPMFIGCPPGKRLAFDITTTLNHNKMVNKRYLDCVNKDPEMPCFLYSDPFFPFFLVQDMVTGESGSFNGSYILKVIGGGTSKDNIVDYSEADIFRYNSPNDTTESNIWTVKDNSTDAEAFSILRYNSPGIVWLCLKNSPCHDIIPESIYSPDFFFKIMVSNRGVDTSTYCDYQLIFILHIHGLPLSSGRALFFLQRSVVVCLILLSGYLLVCFIWLPVKNACLKLRMKFTDLLTQESYYSYTMSGTTLPSMISSKISTTDKISIRKSGSKKMF
ncbi:cation channel sperm-associated auxiliary subunit gamma-like isoform X2 [Macrotis lagotis]|uniref:cation channel sperm-associated auxiliary subunit gamma-like isoform X2 n=1 Tax=Macrotis lagotis TaxID=92651 RepID=UPI003D684E60